MKNIQKNLKKLREEKGWTQEQLAEKLFVTKNCIANYEQGIRKMDNDMIHAIAELFNIEWQPKDKKDITVQTISFSDIAKNNNMSLSASDYINENIVTLRGEIKQGTKKKLREYSEENNKDFNETLNKALELFIEEENKKLYNKDTFKELIKENHLIENLIAEYKEKYLNLNENQILKKVFEEEVITKDYFLNEYKFILKK